MKIQDVSLSQPDEVVVLQTRFHKITVGELINYAIRAAKFSKKTIIGNVNIRAMNFAYELPWYRDFINGCDLVFCDGFGVLLGAKLCGFSVSKEHRMTGPDYIESLVKTCEKQDVSIFLLAGRPGVVDKAIAKFKIIAPNLRVAGHHGFFDKTGDDNDAVIEAINQFKPDILYVGFGMPLQERWIRTNMHKINARVFLPMGACLDFYTGTVKRGPSWMTDRGLEWLSRLIIEPGRLWERYLLGNLLFFRRVIVDLISRQALFNQHKTE